MKVEYEACEIARLQAAVLKKDAQILEFETSILEKLVTLDQRAAGAVTDSMPQVCRPPEFMVVKTTILQERA